LECSFIIVNERCILSPETERRRREATGLRPLEESSPTIKRQMLRWLVYPWWRGCIRANKCNTVVSGTEICNRRRSKYIRNQKQHEHGGITYPMTPISLPPSHEPLRALLNATTSLSEIVKNNSNHTRS
jgi:hypothetical protein